MKRRSKTAKKTIPAKPIKVASGFQEDKSTAGHIFVGGVANQMAKTAQPIKVASASREDNTPATGGHIFVGGVAAPMMKAAAKKRAVNKKAE